ncbi:hypothetical protein OSS46_29675 [Delftia tsuruhatensis]|nr:hypothetical protein [Delftia tsuruhatensis]
MHSQICEARKTSGAWTPLYAGAAPAAVAPEHPPMPETWAVVASIEGQDVVCISSNALSGKGELTESEEQAVIGMAQHLLAFVGYGLPPCDFDADDEPAPAPALEAPAAPPVPADDFRGDTPSLVRNIVALLELDADGALVPHGVGGHARGLLSAAAARLAAAPQAPAQEAPAATALAAEFTDQSIADPVEKARRYLKAMADEAPNSVYFFDDGYPRRASSQDAKAALVVLEQLAARAPAPQAPAAPSGLPSGWVPCILTHDGQHPEEVAYGPQIMTDRLKKWLGRYFELLAQAAPAAPAVDASDTALLDALAAESMDLRCFDMPTGQGDADVGWRVIQHHMGEPTERVVSEVYKDDPRSAIRAAIARLERDPYCTGALHEEDAAQATAKGAAS